MAGFDFAYRLSGGAPTIQEVVLQDTETITKGDLVSIQAGSADLAATNDADLAGAALETVAGTAGVDKVRIITDDDAVYAVTDANARAIGATLDISGATGAMTVTTSSNADVIVVADSSATEPTLVRITPAEHFNA